ncbi:LOG family protein, partial [Pseudomonas massiliensis]|uniref:LOG family protein n=1 Tax=Pseudomonas massiliensis TaxID=522492 RepID=UPI00059065C2
MPYQHDTTLGQHLTELDPTLLEQVDAQLARLAPGSPNTGFYRDMILTALRMAHEDRSRWHAKITLQTVRELDKAFRALEPHQGRRKVTVFGSARTPWEHPVYALARELGAALARDGFMVITGGGGGVMAAAHEGAGAEHSLGFNITLPFEQQANPTIHGSERLLSFHFFFVRKLFFVKEADAIVLCPGGFGTLDEALEVITLIQTGKSPLVPVVLLDAPGGTFWQDALGFVQRQLESNRYILPSDLKLMKLVHSAQDAVEEISQFYANFHSSRWLNQQFIIRMHHPLTPNALARLEEDFADLKLEGEFAQFEPTHETADEPELAHLTRLVFSFIRRGQGRLRELVNFINQQENWARP